MKAGKDHILLAFFGDDLTGSTDALEFLSRAGARTVLFFQLPSSEQLNRYQPLDAVGIAGMTRSMPPDEMESVLTPAFAFFKTIHPRHIHYKVCSTFDSAPTIGSIGKAIDTGARILDTDFIPLLVAAPDLGRYCCFGNLFARMGIASKGEIHRLDRHPSMRDHPVTPADESDLRLHLGKQTGKPIRLFNILDIERPVEERMDKLRNIFKQGQQIVLFDAIYEYQMKRIGHLIDHFAEKNTPVFSVGSSGIEKALGESWAEKGILKKQVNWKKLEKKEPILVLSGSCSPVTAEQIEWALSQGFHEVPVDPDVLTEKEGPLVIRYAKQAASFLKEGKNVILHTCKGPKDPRIKRTNAILNKKSTIKRKGQRVASLYGQVLGHIARLTLKQTPVERMVIAGGDTSGYAARSLGIEGVEMIAPLVAGAPMCSAFAPDSPADKIELNLKGGQVGDKTYFGIIAQGSLF